MLMKLAVGVSTSPFSTLSSLMSTTKTVIQTNFHEYKIFKRPSLRNNDNNVKDKGDENNESNDTNEDKDSNFFTNNNNDNVNNVNDENNDNIDNYSNNDNNKTTILNSCSIMYFVNVF